MSAGEVKRYDHTPRVGWDEDEHGDWVKYEDHDAAMQSLLEELADMTEERDDCRKALARFDDYELVVIERDALTDQSLRQEAELRSLQAALDQARRDAERKLTAATNGLRHYAEQDIGGAARAVLRELAAIDAQLALRASGSADTKEPTP